MMPQLTQLSNLSTSSACSLLAKVMLVKNQRGQWLAGPQLPFQTERLKALMSHLTSHPSLLLLTSTLKQSLTKFHIVRQHLYLLLLKIKPTLLSSYWCIVSWTKSEMHLASGLTTALPHVQPLSASELSKLLLPSVIILTPPKDLHNSLQWSAPMSLR